MTSSHSRRKFIGKITAAGAGLYFGIPHVFSGRRMPLTSFEPEPLFNWSDWEKYRGSVIHPCLTLKPQNISFARENIKQYQWAKDYSLRNERIIRRYFHLITPEFIGRMIETTTPGDPLWTPCPSCRDLGKPVHPHGLWTWNIEDPEILKCDICGEVFPNKKYPEEIVTRTKWGKPQDLSWCGGDPFVIFGYKEGRPSFSANIRSRKVQWIANYCRTLAEGYLLTDNVEYAIACRNILSRFADCYPYWLVHVGYGEFADMDPRIASQFINSLPEDEICPPPNRPDKSLWTGFWSAGRASGVGLESDFVRKVAAAYDLTCKAKNRSGKSVYSDDERKKIERDLLLESTILLVCDKKINNKSVSNRTAVALVGMCAGHPGLVRFGLEGFDKTVNGWYLPDGTTSESPFYGLMTLGGIWDMAEAAKGYSDPAGYTDEAGKRIDGLDLYHGSSYNKVLDSFYRGLQGDLHYPPYADSFRSTKLDTAYVELMVSNYPEKKEYLSLLKELCGDDLKLHSGSPEFNTNPTDRVDDEPVLTLPYDLTRPEKFLSFSLFYRRPGLENTGSAPLKLEDWCPPDLRIGHLRTGTDGRESLLLMSASDWGGHHEMDSLNLYYWKNGNEVLSDPGYLWDHPLKMQNSRTLAHNTVVIDEKSQVSNGRKGEVLLFDTSQNVKVMEMTTSAYPETSLYRRTSAIIDHGDGRNYVVDFFRVDGGKVQDYVFHCVDSSCEVSGINLKAFTGDPLYDLKNIRSGEVSEGWKVRWNSGKMNCVAHMAEQKGEEVFITDGWGQRDWKNSDIGATVPYIIRRCKGAGIRTFISVFEGYGSGEPLVRSIKILDQKGVIDVETSEGHDYILSALNASAYSTAEVDKISLSGHFAVVSIQNGVNAWSYNS